MGNFLGDGKGGPGVGPNALDPLDLRKSGATAAAQNAAELQAGAARAGIGEQRRQFDATSARLAPFFQAGMGALPDVANASTAGGLDERLHAIMTGSAFPELLKYRQDAASNAMSQAGLTRSGEAVRQAAQTPTDLAMLLEQQLFGRQQGLMGTGQNAAAGLGAFGSNEANSITELLRRQGDAYAQGNIAQAQIASQRTSNTIGAATSVASYFFSDPRLKDNMEPIGKIGPLTLYEWDWKPAIAQVLGTEMSLGFDADEVERHFPEHVIRKHSFLMIDYPALTAKLAALLSLNGVPAHG